MLCILFGHAPGSSMARLTEQMKNPGFECRRCGSIVMWSDMHRKIRAMRDEYLRRVSSPLSKQHGDANPVVPEGGKHRDANSTRT